MQISINRGKYTESVKNAEVDEKHAASGDAFSTQPRWHEGSVDIGSWMARLRTVHGVRHG